MKLMTYVAFFFFLVGLTIALYSLWANSRSGRHRAMSIAGFLFALWGFSMVPVYGADSMSDALFWYKISILGILFLIPAVYWIYLDQANVRPGLKWSLIAFCVAVGIAVYMSYWFGGFLFTSFEPGVYGNIGMTGQQTIWYALGSAFYSTTNLGMVVLMFWCRSKAPTIRLRKLYGTNAIGLILSAIAFSVAIVLENNGWPPLDMVAAGVYLFGVNFYMAGRYGYLLREPVLSIPLIQDQVRDPLFILKPDATISAMNLAAKRMIPENQALNKAFDQCFALDQALSQTIENAVHSKSHEHGHPLRHQGKNYLLNVAVQLDRFGDISGMVVCLGPVARSIQNDSDLGITPREREILDLVLQGYANKTIADALFISLGTVKTYLYNIYKKIGVESRLELMNKLRGAV